MADDNTAVNVAGKDTDREIWLTVQETGRFILYPRDSRTPGLSWRVGMYSLFVGQIPLRHFSLNVLDHEKACGTPE